MEGFDRRGFLRAAGIALAAGAALAPSDALATVYNVEVDEGLFKTINRVKDPNNMTGLELHHVPQIKAPEKVKRGEPFMVEVSIGKELHPVSEQHRIMSVELMAGNQPVGIMVYESTFAQPRAGFLVSLDKPVTLIAQARCNLHGLWEGSVDVSPV